jgi:hypothetical protein
LNILKCNFYSILDKVPGDLLHPIRQVEDVVAQEKTHPTCREKQLLKQIMREINPTLSIKGQ